MSSNNGHGRPGRCLSPLPLAVAGVLFAALGPVGAARGQFYTMSPTSVTTCSGVFTDTGGTLGGYGNNEQIVKTFTPSNAGDFLRFDFTWFDTELCCDPLRIYDGNSTAAPLIGAYVGMFSPGVVMASSPGGALTFEFTSDESYTVSGWEAKISCVSGVYQMGPSTVSTCSGIFTDSGGPNAPYADNEHIVQTFTPGIPGGALLFDFASFDTELCCDPLRIFDGDSTAAPMIGSFGGSNSPGVVVASSPSGALTFEFSSDESFTLGGWNATISCVSDVYSMNGSPVSTCSGIFTDSGGAYGAYGNNQNIVKTFTPGAPGTTLRFDFTSFATENSLDVLRIYDGPTTAAPLIGNFSGTAGPGIVTSSSVDGSLTFWFTSDMSFTLGGWSAMVSCVPAIADNCASAVPIADGVYFGSTSGAVVDGSASCGLSNTAADVWYSYRNSTPNLLRVTAETCGMASYDTVLSAHSSCGIGELVCNDDTCGADSRISWLLPIGATHRIRVAGFSGARGDFGLAVSSQVVGDTCADAIPITDGAFYGSTSGATNDGSSTCGQSTTSPDLWYAYTNTTANPLHVTADTIGETFYDSVLSAHDACGGGELACNDDADGLQSRIDWVVPAGATHLIRVTGFNNAAGNFRLDVSSAIANDACSGASSLACGQTVTGDTTAAAAESQPLCNAADGSGGAVWFDLVGAGDMVELTTCHPGTAFDTVVRVYTGNCAALTCVAGNDDGSPSGADPDPACVVPATGSTSNRASTVRFTADAGVTYHILVNGFGSSEGPFELSAACVASPVCPCELDSDTNQVNVFDLLAYLALWFPQNGTSGMGLTADYNNSGNVDVFDLLDFLACWFPASSGSPCP